MSPPIPISMRPSSHTTWRSRLSSATFHQPLLIHALRLILLVAVYSVELGSFWPYISQCRNRFTSEAKKAPIQLLVVTDPQIITSDPHPSYPGVLPKVFFPVIRAFTDRYLARAWRALKSPGDGNKHWTATIWMGDLTDTGRDHYLQQGLPELYDRFERLFPKEEKSNTFYLPGNHDVALQPHDRYHDPSFNAYWLLQTREYTRVKYLHMFGTTVQDLGWDAEPIFPPTSLSHTLTKPRPDGLVSTSNYTTKKDHSQRKTFNARIPIKVAHLDGSPPSVIAEILLLDATDVVSLQRMGRHPKDVPPDGRPGAEADWRFGPTWWFLDEMGKSTSPEGSRIPRILFTHIPLYRDPSTSVSDSCSLPSNASLPLNLVPGTQSNLHRESSRPLQMGTDFKGTYENMINQEWSSHILEKLQPSVIFSGDDHDLCHHLHNDHTPELTVPAISITSGTHSPGYARISIQPQPQSHSIISYTPCTLPYQVTLWIQIYPFLLILTGVILFIRRKLLFQRTTSRSKYTKQDLDPEVESHPLHVIGGEDDNTDDEIDGGGSSSRQRSRSPSRRRSRSRSPSRNPKKRSNSGLLTSPIFHHRPLHPHPTTSHPTSPSTSIWTSFVSDLFHVVWVPFLYWLLLWIFGF
ncbi:unnamed protein product [Sympodiomycopsis kandeliae]